jgi:type I restriction enzyme, S subunit
MKYVNLYEICRPKQWKTIATKDLHDEGYPVYGANGIIGFYNKYNHEQPTIAITCRGATCGSLNITRPFSYINGNAMALDDLDPELNLDYLFYYLNNRGFNDVISGSAQPQITRQGLEKVNVLVYEKNLQDKIADILKQSQLLIEKRQQQIQKLDNLILSVFYKMFGNPQNNNMKWKKLNFDDMAIIDTKMTKDFSKYLDKPHIGINNIEKNTGILKNFNTVKDDNIISGKYIFTSDHIIYSKIRPNLNKVAIPNFDGLCSADSYPILVKSDVCNRMFFAYILRSNAFLDFILKLSSRTNIPKVNKSQIRSFSCICPPIELQNKFASIVEKVENQKELLNKSLIQMENNFNSLMQKAFKGELF